jgi:UDP-N-acetylglucosamine 2-epimerase (non-hydrolysing)
MIHIFIGTKAQLIKMAPVMSLLQKQHIEYNFIFSGQHKETIDDLRKNFGVKAPDFILYEGKDITTVLQMLVWSVRLIIKSFSQRKRLWKGDKNGIVLNHGDTFSTLIGTVLAKISGQKSAHIESGLRSFNLLHPFPEELTRILVFRMSDYYFCPGSWAVSNLTRYGGHKINTEANTLSDALRQIVRLPAPQSLEIPEDKYAVVTLHRFENLFKSSQLENIVTLLEEVANRIPLLFILHKPTEQKLVQFGLMERLVSNSRIELRPRYDYASFIHLIKSASFVISDGGSNQEECAYLGKPCLLFRNATERKEGLGENVVLSKFSRELVLDFVENYKSFERSETVFKQSPSGIIVDAIRKFS